VVSGKHTQRSSEFAAAVADSAAEAREALLQATPPNRSFTQERNFSERQIDRAIKLGFRRPAWVWIARDHGGAILGVVAGWGAEHRATPFILDFLDLPFDRPEIARALLELAVRDSSEPDRATMDLIHFLPSTSGLDDPDVAALIETLANSGFRMLVRRRRYRLDVLGARIEVPPTNLRFDSIERADDPRLPAIMADILVGSLDAHDVDALSRGDLETVAAETVAEYLERDPFESMYLALDPEDRVVGLVIGGLRGSPETGTASFIGVSHRHRGHGYAAQLLGWITRRIIADGALFIVAETDDDNFPMAAAFTKVGYPHTESRIDFVRDLVPARKSGSR
jgi:ribosomal protein S18 acetylase RimI-like enzyme